MRVLPVNIWVYLPPLLRFWTVFVVVVCLVWVHQIDSSAIIDHLNIWWVCCSRSSRFMVQVYTPVSTLNANIKQLEAFWSKRSYCNWKLKRQIRVFLESELSLLYIFGLCWVRNDSLVYSPKQDVRTDIRAAASHSFHLIFVFINRF